MISYMVVVVYIKAIPPLLALQLSIWRMKKINLLLRKCKTLSRQLGRTSSYSSLRSRSNRDERFFWGGGTGSELLQEDDDNNGRSSSKSATVLVGNSRRRYVISSKHLNHPVLSALIERSSSSSSSKQNPGGGNSDIAVVKCEVVLFDHLLWMLENADPNLSSDIDNNSLEELAYLYAL